MAEIKSPVAGTVWKILVAVGDSVEEGDELIILESMKMEIPVEAEQDGTIGALHVEEGTPVQEDDPLLTLE